MDVFECTYLSLTVQKGIFHCVGSKRIFLHERFQDDMVLCQKNSSKNSSNKFVKNICQNICQKICQKICQGHQSNNEFYIIYKSLPFCARPISFLRSFDRPANGRQA